MKKRQNFTFESKYILMIVTVLCVAMIGISFFTNLSAGPFKNVAGYVFVPIQNGINEIGLWMSDKTDNLKELKEVMAENETLKAQLDELSLENNLLQQDKYELEELRELYKLDQKYPSYNKVAARIIGNETGNWFDIFLIDKGSDDGLAPDMNVIAGSGLVGIIIEVGPTWATVRSIIDDSSNVSAMVLNTSDTCIVTGDLKLMDQNNIRFFRLNDSDDQVNVGDKVVTSHISSKFLQGIEIGYISEITTDANNLTKSGCITPIVDFAHLQSVLVITDLKEQKSE